MSEEDAIKVEIRAIREDMSWIKQTLSRLAETQQLLARLEERHNSHANALERVFKGLESLDSRVKLLEADNPEQRKTADWVSRAMWSAVIVVAVVVLRKAGLM